MTIMSRAGILKISSLSRTETEARVHPDLCSETDSGFDFEGRANQARALFHSDEAQTRPAGVDIDPAPKSSIGG